MEGFGFWLRAHKAIRTNDEIKKDHRAFHDEWDQTPWGYGPSKLAMIHCCGGVEVCKLRSNPHGLSELGGIQLLDLFQWRYHPALHRQATATVHVGHQGHAHLRRLDRIRGRRRGLPRHSGYVGCQVPHSVEQSGIFGMLSRRCSWEHDPWNGTRQRYALSWVILRPLVSER